MTDHDEEHYIHKVWQSFTTYKNRCYECEIYMSDVIKADTDEFPYNYTEKLQHYYEWHKDDKGLLQPLNSIDYYDNENYGRKQYIYQGQYSINKGRILGKQAIKHHNMNIQEYRGFVLHVNSRGYTNKDSLKRQVFDFRRYTSCEICDCKITFEEQTVFLSWEWFTLHFFHEDCVDIYTVYKRLRDV